MRKATIRLRDDIDAALDAYLRDHPETAGVRDLAEHLLEEFLRGQGYLEPFISLEIPVGPPGSAEPADSENHDWVSVEAWMTRRDAG